MEARGRWLVLTLPLQWHNPPLNASRIALLVVLKTPHKVVRFWLPR